MVNARPTVERRQLGLSLRRFRELAGRSQLEAGQRVGKGDARISRIEDGLATLTTSDLEALLEFYEVDDVDRQAVLELGMQARKRQPRKAYVDSLPGSFQRLADLETSASRIYSYESGVVPGLLQSPSYMDALFHAAEGVWWDSPDQTRKSRTNFRAQRQEMVWRDAGGKKFHFVIGEAALDDTVDGPDVMIEQLEHLLDVMRRRDEVIVQLLPRTVPNNPARGGGLTVLEFAAAVPRVGFASVVRGPSAYFDGSEDTEAMIRTFHRLIDLALTPSETGREMSRKLKRLKQK